MSMRKRFGPIRSHMTAADYAVWEKVSFRFPGVTRYWLWDVSEVEDRLAADLMYMAQSIRYSHGPRSWQMPIFLACGIVGGEHAAPKT